jgi:hypothetical protein
MIHNSIGSLAEQPGWCPLRFVPLLHGGRKDGQSGVASRSEASSAVSPDTRRASR